MAKPRSPGGTFIEVTDLNTSSMTAYFFRQEYSTEELNVKSILRILNSIVQTHFPSVWAKIPSLPTLLHVKTTNFPLLCEETFMRTSTKICSKPHTERSSVWLETSCDVMRTTRPTRVEAGCSDPAGSAHLIMKSHGVCLVVVPLLTSLLIRTQSGVNDSKGAPNTSLPLVSTTLPLCAGTIVCWNKWLKD